MTTLWYCRKKKLVFWRLADTLAPGVALAQGAGIFACLLNGDSYGRGAELARGVCAGFLFIWLTKKKKKE